MQYEKTYTIGKKMAFVAWILGLFLLTRLFATWEESKEYPNKAPASVETNSQTSVTLKQNRHNHYLVGGMINRTPANFMIDTGATDVVVPSALASKFSLQSMGTSVGITANGYVQLERTTIKEISIAGIRLYNVRASINPGMDASQAILLGMSALAQLDLQQQQGTLTMTQHK